MTQPKFAPIAQEDEVRPAYRLEPPAPWRASRPAEIRPASSPTIRGGGVPGPDQGYALRLAERFEGALVLEPGEHAEDVLAAAVAIGLRRAASFGRAPVSDDIELPLVLFGYLAPASPDEVERRRPLVAGASHDYVRLRSIVESIPKATLRSTLAGVRSAGAAPGASG